MKTFNDFLCQLVESRQGLRTAEKRLSKTSYKGLSPREKKIVKAKEAHDIAERYLFGRDGFYAKAPRLKNGAVDWSKLTDRQIAAFDNENKKYEALSKFNEHELKAALDKHFQHNVARNRGSH